MYTVDLKTTKPAKENSSGTSKNNVIMIQYASKDPLDSNEKFFEEPEYEKSHTRDTTVLEEQRNITNIHDSRVLSFRLTPCFDVIIISGQKNVTGSVYKNEEHEKPLDEPGILQFLKRKTKGRVVIMDKNTFLSTKSIPDYDRNIIVVTRNYQLGEKYSEVPSIKEALSLSSTFYKKVVIIKNGEMFTKELNLYRVYVKKVHLLKSHQDTPCSEIFLSSGLKNLDLEKRESTENFEIRTYHYQDAPFYEEIQYLQLMFKILREGKYTPSRTSIPTYSIFSHTLVFDLSDNSIPLLNTKKVPFRMILVELLWFLSGRTEVDILRSYGVKIWDANTTRDFLDNNLKFLVPEGTIGAGYGFQWRHFGATYQGKDVNYEGKGVDQVKEVIEMLKTTPYSRRIIISAWNPSSFIYTALEPCHILIQFYVREETDGVYLDGQLYQRSADVALGLCWNFVSYSILLRIIASIVKMKPGKLYHVLGNAHIYENHIDGVLEHLKRRPRTPFPKLTIKRDLKNIDDLFLEPVGILYNLDLFKVEGYEPQDPISFKMAV